MKFMIPMILALFPYLHDTSYPVTLQSCESNHIVIVSEGVPLSLTLFNLKMSDEKRGWAKTCALLQDAKQLTMEIDASSAIDDPLAVYLFADNVLIQEELVRENLAYTLIHNPEYSYERKLMELAKANSVMAEPDAKGPSPYMSYGWVFLMIIFLIWSSCIGYLLYKNRRFIIKNTRQKK